MKPRDSATAVVTEGLADSPARALPAGAWLDEFVLEEIIVEGSVTILEYEKSYAGSASGGGRCTSSRCG